MVKLIANRLANAEAVKRARVFPYQLLAAFKSAGADVPNLVRDALQDAMEVATQNVPRITGKVYVCPDVSGSMGSPVTGHRVGATTAVRCIDVAALVAASILRQNPQAEVVPFETAVVTVSLNGRDSVMTNAQKLTAIGGGGTNCSAPLAWLNARKAQGDLVVFVSDNESWADAKEGRGYCDDARMVGVQAAQSAGAVGVYRHPAERHRAGGRARRCFEHWWIFRPGVSSHRGVRRRPARCRSLGW